MGFVQVMRENARDMDQAWLQRVDHFQSMNAVQNMQSYELIGHADRSVSDFALGEPPANQRPRLQSRVGGRALDGKLATVTADRPRADFYARWIR
jgi:hypothetical protein